jgi:hypothetical protein
MWIMMNMNNALGPVNSNMHELASVGICALMDACFNRFAEQAFNEAGCWTINASFMLSACQPLLHRCNRIL